MKLPGSQGTKDTGWPDPAHRIGRCGAGEGGMLGQTDEQRLPGPGIALPWPIKSRGTKLERQ